MRVFKFLKSTIMGGGEHRLPNCFKLPDFSKCFLGCTDLFQMCKFCLSKLLCQNSNKRKYGTIQGTQIELGQWSVKIGF